MALFTCALLALSYTAGSRVHTSQHRLRVRGGAGQSHVFLKDAAAVETAPPPPAPPVATGKSAEGLSTVTLTHPSNGDSAVIYTLGACVTSYTHAGIETLKIRPDAKMDGSKPISGGIPHCFPQFGPGAIQQHGFARNLDWEVASTEEGPNPTVVLRLADNDETRAMWPHAFEALYTVTLTADELKTEMKVHNTGDAPFTFTGALHSYFDISAVKNIKIEGNFDNARFLDKTANPPAERVHKGNEVTISKETDSVYTGVTGEVKIVDSGKKAALAIKCSQGWRDTVVWNPFGDEGMGYNSFVCAEAAVASFPITLQPGTAWTGLMDLESTKL